MLILLSRTILLTVSLGCLCIVIETVSTNRIDHDSVDFKNVPHSIVRQTQTVVNVYQWRRCLVCPHHSLFHCCYLHRPLPSTKSRSFSSPSPSNCRPFFFSLTISSSSFVNTDRHTRQDVGGLKHEALRPAVRRLSLPSYTSSMLTSL